MPLETADQPHQLNAANPPDTDPGAVGAAHLRLLKDLIKKIGLGQMTLTELKASTAQAGTFAVYNNRPYVIVNDTIFGSTAIEDENKAIFLNNGKKAVCLFPFYWLGEYLGETPVVPTLATANRMPTVVFVQGPGTAFDDSAITAACPGGVAVRGDMGFYLTASGATRFSAAKQFDGTTWVYVDVIQNGASACFGTMAALMFNAQRVHGIYTRTHRLELVGNEKVEIRNPDGFGPDNLYYWLGTKAIAIDGVGAVRYDALTKANSIRWGGYQSNGAAQEGGSTGGDTGGETTPPASAVLANLGIGGAYGVEVHEYNNSVANASVIINLLKNGNFSVTGSMGITGTPRSGAMVTTPGAGVGALYEYKVELLSGGPMSGLTAGFQTLSEDAFVYVATSAGPNPSTTAVTATIRITLREKANTANSQTRDVILNASAQSHDGYEP